MLTAQRYSYLSGLASVPYLSAISNTSSFRYFHNVEYVDTLINHLPTASVFNPLTIRLPFEGRISDTLHFHRHLPRPSKVAGPVLPQINGPHAFNAITTAFGRFISATSKERERGSLCSRLNGTQTIISLEGSR